MMEIDVNARDNSHLMERLQIKTGDQIQVLLPGAMISGYVDSIEDFGATVLLNTNDEPPIRWSINARQLIAVGRVEFA